MTCLVWHFRTQTGDWIDVPTVRDAFIVNGGQLLLRWTNDTFLATPHRAVNRTGSERYALAFFCDAQIDWPIAAVPTCVGSGRPPRYETTYYTDYMIRYQARTYNRPPKIIVLDMDSSESPTYGEQEGSAYNGHFGCTCYHPLFV